MIKMADITFKIHTPAPHPQGFWGERLFIFRELVSTGNYFSGTGEQAHNLGDLGSPAQK